ncbi:exopolysaccharide Pel transporter PelG [Paenibacillus mendelii]|uniref:Exopolysaccharide Pel transporter PelG n=1 Tax=Paenibacillus mendelii TaxID=206163 RepID=A0ABV6JBV4_9BACL|nr:exopolysaccharide Pel transporter PelG [Paenibacillus mendelii]MCQ6562654.1 exopolysaccharide Pel transporter PelG [Paenibacillus mendelii]
MAGIGFELRKLFQGQGLINHVRAYAYSSLTTIGPMILCMFLIIALQRMMSSHDASYLEWELYIATVTYCFIFSIVVTSGISMVLTRFLADMLYQKKFDHILSSFYGALIVCLPLGGLAAWIFLRDVAASAEYKVGAYLFFMELIMIWIQSVYLSALKDYIRIVRSFAIGVVAALAAGWLLFTFTALDSTTAALFSIDVGFFMICIMSMHHFKQIFPRSRFQLYFSFLSYFKKYPALFFTGCFMYAGVYIHNFVYWLGPDGREIANQYLVMPMYDLPVFYAFLSVVPSLVMFVVSIETSFYEKFRVYYLQVLDGGTLQEINKAKKAMQRTLIREIGFLMEVQLLFTVLSIAIGMKLLPKIGFTMAQLDVFIVLVLGYFLFIMMFVFLHILMYFDDRKGVLGISGLFVLLSAGMTYWMMIRGDDGLGMFIAAFIGLAAVILRLLYVLRNIDYYTFCSQPLMTKGKQPAGKTPLVKSSTVLSSVVVMALLLSACSSEASDNSEEKSGEVKAPVTVSEPRSGLTEDKRIYDRDEDASLKALYVTILPDKEDSALPVNWYALNRMTDRYSEENLEIIVQEGKSDGSGPAQGEFGYGQTSANAKISLRGNTARNASQKSYKIKLYDEAGLWHNQRTLNLNKHIMDLSRMRNKLSFDLMETIPSMTSLRTQFVQLYVKDLSEGAAKASYQDYGLYTQIEQPNELFLKSHWLDPNGNLYKVTFFEFQRYPDLIKSHNDPTYDKKSFETILEIKGREEHDKLISMLDDLNNLQIPINDVIEKHFDLENILTWTAMNILMDNMDTDANNFYLYSPLNSEKWYFIPWDYDGGWELQREKKDIHLHQNGLSNYWANTLHNRYFRTQEHIQQLTDKIEELSLKYINKDTIGKQIDKYRDTVKPFLFRNPDIQFLPGFNKDFDKELQQLMDTPERGKQRYLEDLEKPRPFFLHDVELDDAKVELGWDISYDFQGDNLTYDLAVAKDPLFTQIVAQKTGLSLNSVTIGSLKPGTYYWKVVARDSKGHEQNAFDYYLNEDGDYFYGMREFEVD